MNPYHTHIPVENSINHIPYMSISIDINTMIGHFKKSDLLVVSARHLAFFSAGVKVGLHPRAVGVQILLAFCWLARFGFV